MDLDVEVPDGVATLLERWTGHPSALMQGMTLRGCRTLLPAPLSMTMQGSGCAPRHQYCPLCLAEDDKPYGRLLWSLSWSVVCVSHGVVLVNGCPRCAAGPRALDVVWPFRDLAQCAVCGADLRTARAASAGKQVCQGQERIESTYLELLRIGNASWTEQYVLSMTNLPNALRGIPNLIPGGCGFSGMPIAERVRHIRLLSGSWPMESILRQVGGDALLRMLPETMAPTIHTAAFKWRRRTKPDAVLRDLRRTNAGGAERRQDNAIVRAVAVRPRDVIDLAFLIIKPVSDAQNDPMHSAQINKIKEWLVSMWAIPHSWVFIMRLRCQSIGWSVLCGNTIIRLILPSEWDDFYGQALFGLEKAMIERLGDYSFDALEATVSEHHLRCFEFKGWQRTGKVPEDPPCDWPVRLPPTIKTYTMARPIASSNG